MRILNDSLVTCVYIYIDLIQMTVTIVNVVCIIQFGRPIDKQIITFKGNRSLRPQAISPRSLNPLFSSKLVRFKCNVPRSIFRKAKQVRFKCNIPRSLSHTPKQASFEYNIARSEIGGQVYWVE